MTTINCRGTIIELDNNILKYFPFIENILKYKNEFTKFENNVLKLNIDPIIMTELVNFYVMPYYRIPIKYISNVKELAKYMGHGILTTVSTNEKVIDNVYKINQITMELTCSKNNTQVQPINSFIRKCININVSENIINCIFDGLAENPRNYSIVPESEYSTSTWHLSEAHITRHKIPGYIDYESNFYYLANYKSLKIINSMLFNSTIKIDSRFNFNIIYEKIC